MVLKLRLFVNTFSNGHKGNIQKKKRKKRELSLRGGGAFQFGLPPTLALACDWPHDLIVSPSHFGTTLFSELIMTYSWGRASGVHGRLLSDC